MDENIHRKVAAVYVAFVMLQSIAFFHDIYDTLSDSDLESYKSKNDNEIESPER